MVYPVPAALDKYADNIKADFLKRLLAGLKVIEGDFLYMLLFGLSDGFFRRAVTDGSSSLNLYKNDGMGPGADDIDFSMTAAKVALQNFIPLFLQKLDGQIFTLGAQFNSAVLHHIFS